MFAPSLLLLGCLACMAAAHPIQSDVDDQWLLVRAKRSPMAARTMILVRGQPTNAGYHYAKPERTFNPRAAMAAYATGGTVAAGSFYGASSQKQKCGDCNEHPEVEETKSVDPPAPEEAPEEVEEKEVIPERKPKAPKAPKAPKVPSKRRPVKDDDDEDDDEDDGSTYRNFFPMMFGGAGSRGRLQAADDEGDAEGGRGPVTAIANSFSQGRGAIASSSAVAHGRPDPSQQKQSQQSRHRARA